MEEYICEICGHIYDPQSGDRESSTPPGTAFENLPQEWTCPVCCASRKYFEQR